MFHVNQNGNNQKKLSVSLTQMNHDQYQYYK